MQEDNREKFPLPEDAPQHGGEIVGWYVPRQEEPQEVRGCYVQPRPMPAAAMPAAPAQTAKVNGRTGLWIFLLAVAVLLGVVIAVAVVSGLRGGGDFTYDDDHDASSIVDIFGEEIPSIPRVKAEEGLRFYCRDAAEDEKLTIQQMYARVNPATVLVVVELGEKASIGTGVILTEDGYIVTNAHVIAGGSSVTVALYDDSYFEAELVGFDSGQDLAVLKAKNVTGLPTAELGSSDSCLVGDTVYAIGNPLGVELRGTLTEGIISAIDRQVTLEGRVMTLLQTTAALNNGNSGGPLINEYGQVIGINTLKMSRTGSDEGSATVEALGFAVPSGQVMSVINDIVATGAFHGLPSIGVYVKETEQPDGTVRPVIDSVTEYYGAEEAGLLRNDVILAADGVEVFRNSDLLAVRRTHIVGETILLTVQRGGEVFDVEVPLYPVDG